MDIRHYNIETNSDGRMTVKWFKFIIYFYMFLAAIGGVIMAYLHFSGEIWSNMLLNYFTDVMVISPEEAVKTIADIESGFGPVKEMFYSQYSSLEYLDIAFGVSYVLYAAGCVAVRFMLSSFKKNAPLCFYIIAVMMSVLSFAHYAAVYFITGRFMGNALQLISTALFLILFIIMNVVYFRKRKYMFTS